MVYQKIINFLDNTPKQLSKLRTENWIKVNDQSRGVCNVNSDIRFKNIMLKSGLCDYSDAYILVKVGITITGAGADAVARKANERDKEVIIKSCAPFINCKSEINNTEIDNAKDIDMVMPMYNSIKYSDSYSKISGRLWQNYKNEPNDNLTDSESFKSKIKLTGKTSYNANTKDVEVTVPLKYLCNLNLINLNAIN